MVTSLLHHERIETTDPKAKELRRLTDHVIGLGKEGSLHARRRALGIIQNKAVVHKLFETLALRFKNRMGGYTRIVKVGWRHGDHAPISLIELMPEKLEGKVAPPSSSKTRNRRRARKEKEATPKKKGTSK